MVQEKMKQEHTEKTGSWMLLAGFLKGSLHLFIYSMLCAGAVSFLDMLGPRVISFTVDSVIGDRPASLPAPLKAWADQGGITWLRGKPWRVAVIVAGIALAAAVFRFLFRYFNAVAAQQLVQTMRERLYRKIIGLPYSWHGRNAAGDIIQRCTSDVETIKVFVSEQLTSLVRVIVLIVLAMAFMWMIDPVMTAAASVYIPVIIGYSLFFYSRIGSAFEKADAQEGILSAIAQENLTGVRVVRAFGREEYERSRFEKQNEQYTGFWVRLMKILTINWVVGDLVTGLQYLLIICMGTAMCVRGRITAGQFIAFFSYNAMLTWPVRSLGRVISEMSKAGISLERLAYILEEPTEWETENALAEKDVQGCNKDGKSSGPIKGDILFRNVSFTYPGSSVPAVRNVSFTVKEGTTVGILGGTGSGKTTLLLLLERVYPLQEGCGEITIGGKNIAQIPLDQLRRSIGIVDQEPFLFSRSLKENLRISAEDASDEELERCVKIADLQETIRSFPSGYDTFVGERGVTLSGGQKQRAAIARTLIRHCPVMIFDDSLSAVDSQTDERIRHALAEETKGATVFLVSHRVSTLRGADLILVMEEGRICEQGTHETLLEKGGMYAKIFRMQSENAPRTAEKEYAGGKGENADEQ